MHLSISSITYITYTSGTCSFPCSLLQVYDIAVALLLVQNVQLAGPGSDLILFGPSGKLLIQAFPGLGPVKLRGDLVAMDKDIVVLLKVTVNVLERTVGRLRVEEVGDGHKRRADDGPDDPETVPEIRDPRRRHLRDHVVHDPVGRHGQTGTFATKRNVIDFGRVEPLFPKAVSYVSQRR